MAAQASRIALDEVLSISGIEHAHFDAHPERLDAYLATDIGGEISTGAGAL